MRCHIFAFLCVGIAPFLLLGCENQAKKLPHASIPPPKARTATIPRDAPVVLVLGDSLAAGHGLPLEQSYPALLQDKVRQAGFPHQVTNAGVTGDTTAGGLERMDWLLRQKIDVLIIALGGNDMLRGVAPTTVKKNLQRIITKGQAAGVKVLLAGMLATQNLGPQYTTQFNAIYPSLAKQHQLAWIPFLLEGVALNPEFNQVDGIHPNAQGAMRVAQTVWVALRPLLEIKKGS